jgi:CubicO group peptidase (beta-lactamase class C family)
VPDPLSPAGLARFAEIAAGHVGPDKIPGLVALLSCDDHVHVEVLGSLSVGGPAMRRGSLFRIASTSKPVTGTSIMALEDEGRVRLDDPVEAWLPELADRRVRRTTLRGSSWSNSSRPASILRTNSYRSPIRPLPRPDCHRPVQLLRLMSVLSRLAVTGNDRHAPIWGA